MTSAAPTSAAGSPARLANLRNVLAFALAGGAGAVMGLYLYVELVSIRSVYIRDAWAGAAIGGSVGFFLNASGPFRDRAWLKLSRAASWGALAGAIGGALGLVLGEVVIGALQGGLLGRSLSWAVLGLGIGVSQGLAERSRQRLKFGILGGLIGGAVGGYIFEALRLLLGNRHDLSQGPGVVILGAGLGASLALVEQALRRAWVQVLSGRQEGRAYLLEREVSTLGLDERADVGLFADALIVRRHATIEKSSRGYVLKNHAGQGRTQVNGADVVGEAVLKDGDRLVLGQTPLVFRQR